MTKQQRTRRSDRLLSFFLLLAIFFGLVPPSGLTPQGYYEARLAALTGQDSFSLSLWTVKTVVSKGWQMIGAKPGAGMTAQEKQRIFDDFFATSNDAVALEWEIRGLANQGVSSADPQLAELESQLRAVRATREAQSGLVERVIQDQMQTILQEQGLSLVQVGNVFFPPVIFKLVDLPRLLVVAHRDRFETRSQVYLRRNITAGETDTVEDTVDGELDVRSLTVLLGGIGVYPTMVGSTGDRSWMIDTVAHEWCHIYLLFRPLGLNYSKNGELTAMNETVCSIFGGDTGALVEQTYYGAAKQPRPWEALPTPTPTPAPTPGAQPTPEAEQGFSINRELRIIYVAAEERLKAGDIAGAERVMEEGRQYLAANGHYERKINQAFFSFYGSYASGPDFWRPDLIGDDLRELRRRTTLRDFMITVAGMDSYDDLKRALGK